MEEFGSLANETLPESGRVWFSGYETPPENGIHSYLPMINKRAMMALVRLPEYHMNQECSSYLTLA